MVPGIVAGYVCHQAAPSSDAANFSIVTDIFLRLIKMIIAPLVFATLVSGIASMDSGKTIGRIGVRAVSWFVCASLISLSIGLLFVNLTHPGTAMNVALPTVKASINLKSGFNLKDFVAHMVSKRIGEAMAGNEIMQILVFPVFFGVGLRKVTGPMGVALQRAIDGLVDVMLHVTNAVMMLAPLRIFAAIAGVVTVQGLGVLLTYGKLIGWFSVALFSLWLCFTSSVVQSWGLSCRICLKPSVNR